MAVRGLLLNFSSSTILRASSSSVSVYVIISISEYFSGVVKSSFESGHIFGQCHGEPTHHCLVDDLAPGMFDGWFIILHNDMTDLYSPVTESTTGTYLQLSQKKPLRAINERHYQPFQLSSYLT